MKVKFVPQNVEVDIPPGKSVLHVAQDHGIYIKSVCKGVPSCAECRVRIVDGEHNVLPPGSEELSLIGTGHFIDRRRLSCQLKCFGDIVVDMTEQIAKSQGLITGQKKKKLAIKDDRIEDSQAYRADKDEIGSEPATLDTDSEEISQESGDRPKADVPVPRGQGRDHRRDHSQHQQQGQQQNQNRGISQNRVQVQNQGSRAQHQQASGGPGLIESQVEEGPRGDDGPRRRRRRRRGPGGGGGGGRGGTPIGGGSR